MTTYTHPKANGLPGRPARGVLDKETVARVRTAPWEPTTASGGRRVLVGLVGAALIGGAALAIVMLSPSRVPKPVQAEPAVVSRTAPAAPASPTDTLPAQTNAEPSAAGNGQAATTDQRAPDTTAPSTSTAAPAAEAPDLRTTRDPRSPPGKTNPPNGE